MHDVIMQVCFWCYSLVATTIPLFEDDKMASFISKTNIFCNYLQSDYFFTQGLSLGIITYRVFLLGIICLIMKS